MKRDRDGDAIDIEELPGDLGGPALMIAYRAALSLVMGVGLSATAALAQQVPTMLPQTLRTAPAISPAEQGQIDAFVKGHVANLESAESAAQSTARDALINAAPNGSSQAFLDAYAKTVDAAVTPLAQSKNWRAKLNAAIVAAKVADKTNSANLSGAATAFLADKDDAIALWGVKIAKAVVPASFAAQGASVDPKLIKAVAGAALTRSNSGAIVAEAYATLAPTITASTQNVGPMVKVLLPELLNLIAARNKAYMTGVPEEPTAENSALLFISLEQVWNEINAEKKGVEVMQRVSDLIGMAGQRVASASRDDVEHIIPMLQQAGKAINVIADKPGVTSPTMNTAAMALGRVNPASGAQAIANTALAVSTAIKATPAFASITPPPTVSPGAPATPGPATTKSVK